ncbi:hypothetical protein H4R20_001133 [Coemansia guatemalensis]|uniref:CCHC-type domain-containing protein n=1 Tax=Coemansia guatemalensis TaxID=2761395 RepID=A0A9W8HXW9_9FUNG|nr:hypothetical protein H4R20_001133 [Coemansia guatemalensis]
MDDEGPAFLSFSGLPDEDVYDFVTNVDALRKHFKWSNQVTFCYARTMLKGSARKIVQSTKPGSSSGNEHQKSRVLSDEAVDPNSWSNLRASLVFEFTEQYKKDREMVQLLTMRQQAGESSSEYAQRFVGLVSGLIVAHPLDSNMLGILFASGLRSEKLRWELLLRRLNTIDKAVGYVAPDQLYKVAKLSSLLSPLPVSASAVGSAGELSPTSEESASFTAAQREGSSAASHTFVDEADEQSLREVYGSADVNSRLDVAGMASLEHDVSDRPSSEHDSGTRTVRGSTANGASFSLDDDGEDGSQGSAHTHQSAMPWPSAGTVPEPAASAAAVTADGYDGVGAEADDRQHSQSHSPLGGNGYWTPPRLPDARQRRQHRQSMSAYARAAAHTSASVSGMLPSQNSWQATARQHHTALPRTGGGVPSRAALPSSLYEADGQGYDDDDYQGPGALDRSLSKASTGTGSEPEDQTRSASELNSLADQLESLTSMLRIQSDARRRRPRLCYRCRQKGHIASECPLPPEMAVPNQQTRERMGLGGSTPQAASKTLPRVNAMASPPLATGSWRAPSSSRSATQSRRYTQSWGRNALPNMSNHAH